MEGINIQELINLGEPLLMSRTPSQAPSHVPSSTSLHSEPEKDEPMRILTGQLTEMECQPPQKPQGTGDDPFGIDNLTLESFHPDDRNIHLEGVLPNKFEGNRVKTLPFLTQFKQFILMNHHITIA
jgi:hypothetical protein